MHFYFPLKPLDKEFQLQKDKEALMEIVKNKVVLIVDSDSKRRLKILNECIGLNMRPQTCVSYEEGISYSKLNKYDLLLTETTDIATHLNVPTIYLQNSGEPSLTLTQFQTSTSTLTQIPTSILSNTNIQSDQFSHIFVDMMRKLFETTVKANGLLMTDQPTIKLNILVVEDNPHNMSVIMEILKKANYDMLCVTQAKSGTEAIQRGVSMMFDVILMDLLLPGVDGFTAATQILNFHKNKGQKQHRGQGGAQRETSPTVDTTTPTIVALTALVTMETQARCKSIGFKGFLSKPLVRDELLTMLSIIATRRKQQ